jgi:hypothetical protein
MLKNEIIKKYQFKRFASKFKKELQKKRTKKIHVILKISEKFYKKQKNKNNGAQSSIE